MNGKKLFLAVFVLKLVLFLAVVGVFGFSKLLWSADALEYIDLGRNLIAGNGFSRTAEGGYLPASDRMPLYPLVVGLDSSLIFVSILQIFAAALIALFTYRIAKRFMRGGWAFFTALLTAFEPLSAVLHVLILPETFLALFILIFIDMFLLYLERSENKFIFFAALSLLLVLYTKPVAMYFLAIPLLVLFLASRLKAFVPAFILAGIFFLGALPWMARNHALGEGFTVSTYGQKALCGYQISAVLGSRYELGETSLGVLMGEIRNFEEYQRRERECFKTSPFSTLFKLARDYPRDFIKVNALAALGYFTNDGYLHVLPERSGSLPSHHNYLTPAVLSGPEWKNNFLEAFRELSSFEKLIFAAGKIFWIGVFLLAVAGCFLGLRGEETRYAGIVLLLTILYFAASSVLGAAFGAGARYRFEINSLLFIFAISALERGIIKQYD